MIALLTSRSDEGSGFFTCAKPSPAAYCAGGSLQTNIILRCENNLRGYPGNCNDK